MTSLGASARSPRRHESGTSLRGVEKPERTLKEAEETIKRLKGARNGLWRRIDRAETRQEILNGWITNLDEL